MIENTIQVVVGFLAGLIGNATQEKLKLAGYGKPAFTIHGKIFGWDDVIGISIGVILLFWKSSRNVGYGVVLGMLYTKFSEGTKLPSVNF